MTSSEGVMTGTMRWPALGIAVFAAAGGWTMVTAAAAGSSAGPTVGLILAAGLTLAAGWSVARRRPAVVAAGVVGAAAAVVAADLGAMVRTGPLQGLGYANATAAFLAQAAIAGLLLVALARVGALRVLGVAAAIGAVVLLMFAGSWAVILLLPSLVLIALSAERVHGPRVAVAVCAGVFLAALLVTQALGATRLGTGSGPADRLIRATISGTRVTLWHEALAITAEEPLLGIGPGRFAIESPTGSIDPDLRWAHHEFLQAGAESGLLGYALSVAIFVWAFAALWVTADGAVSALGAAGLAILGVQATLDHVLHFPVVTLVGAAVVATALGAASARPHAWTPARLEPILGATP